MMEPDRAADHHRDLHPERDDGQRVREVGDAAQIGPQIATQPGALAQPIGRQHVGQRFGRGYDAEPPRALTGGHPPTIRL